MAARRPIPDSRSGFSGVMLVGSPDEMVTMVDPSDDATSRIKASYVDEATRLGFRLPREDELNEDGTFADGRTKVPLPPSIAHFLDLKDEDLQDAKVDTSKVVHKCFVCGFEAKSIGGLKVHRKRKHNL